MQNTNSKGLFLQTDQTGKESDIWKMPDIGDPQQQELFGLFGEGVD